MTAVKSAIGDGGKPRVLVADDNATNRALLTAMLDKLNYRAHAVVNGREAVKALQERAYGLVIIDIFMPEMDGVEATRAIRALPGPLGTVPVIALTADIRPGLESDCRAAGMTMVLTKPLTMRKLTDALQRVSLPSRANP
jgi:CheY-like chemotaxis protein